jgi:hypothetical protein
MSIVAGITATKATLDVAKLVSDMVNRPTIDAALVREKLHELLIHAVNAQTALGDAQQEMAELRRRIDDREAIRAIQDDLEMDVVSRYLVRKSEKDRGLIPYCPTCWGADSKLVPLAIVQHPGLFRCAIHSVAYYSPEQLEHAEKIQRARDSRRQPTAGSGWAD